MNELTKYFIIKKGRSFFVWIDNEVMQPVFSKDALQAWLYTTREQAEKDLIFLQKCFPEMEDLKISTCRRKYYIEILGNTEGKNL